MHHLYSTITNRQKQSKVIVNIGKLDESVLMNQITEKWQVLLNTVAAIYNVPAALIMRLDTDYIEVFLKNQSDGNPYGLKEKTALTYGLYCETAIATGTKLHIPDASQDPVWKDNNPDVDMNMIAYLGLPLFWEEEEIFGTICILDNKENHFQNEYTNFLNLAKNFIETDLKLIRAKEEAERKEELFRTIFSISPAGIAIFNTDWKLLFLNDAFERIDGYPVKDEIGKYFNHNVHPDDLEKINTLVKPLFDGIQKISSGEIRFVHKSGRIIWTTAICTRFPELIDNQESIICVIQDISKIKEFKEQLARENATKEKFISILSHDIGNSFNGLFGFSDILLENLDSFSAEEIKEYLTLIKTTSRKSWNLLEDILSWVKIRSDLTSCNPEKVCARRIAMESMEIFQSNIIAKNITVENCIVEDTMVFADANMLKTIFRNLFSNAVKFTDNHGTIRIDSENSEEVITLSVTDNGAGIPGEHIPGLWNIGMPRKQVETNTEQRSGYGLIICKELVEKHGGRIWVESQPGMGSTFRFTLPGQLEV